MERIIITFERDGKLRGASATDFDGLPVPLDEAALTALFPTLNTAALVAKEESETALENALSDFDAAKLVMQANVEETVAAKDAEISTLAAKAAHLDSIEAAIADPFKDAEETLQAAAAVILESKMPEKEKRKAELRRQLDEIDAEIDKLEDKKK